VWQTSQALEKGENQDMKKNVYIDIESRSAAQIFNGVYPYAEHESTDILCICWAVDDGPVKRWAAWSDEYDDLEELAEIFRNPDEYQLSAYNANFERVMLNAHGPTYGLPRTSVSQWKCSAVLAAMHALPRALGDSTAALGTRAKDEEGKKSMLRLCKPRSVGQFKGQFWDYEEDPEGYKTLIAYCADDVRAERGLATRLPKLIPSEQKFWELDQEINDRGIQVDVDLARNLVEAWNNRKEHLVNRCQELTGFTPSQVGHLKEFLGLEDMKAATIRDALEVEQDPVKREVLEIRAEVSKTSVKKFEKILEAVCEDGRLRGMFLFHGAQPGRWAGRIVQLHNLPRNAADHPEAAIKEFYKHPEKVTGDSAQQLIRPAFQGDPGLLIGDYSGIELRIALWLADYDQALEKIRNGVDMYVDLAEVIFNLPTDKIDSKKRFVGKQAVLGLGYGMGVDRFFDYCAGFGQELPRELCKRTVEVYRDTYGDICRAWTETQMAAMEATKNPGKKVPVLGGKVTYIHVGGFLYCKLPSGRPISYPQPAVVQRSVPWSKTQTRPTLEYAQISPYTRKWGRATTFGGRMFENLCQGIASCLLRDSLAKVNEHYPVVGHVHDEILAEGRERNLKHFISVMEDKPDWAEEIPIKVEAEFSTRYLKP
jgi:DNA polymerase